MKRIAIDARKIGDFGIGTYAEGLLRGLSELEDGGEEYVIFAPSRFLDRVPSRFEKIAADAPNYSVREQVSIARLIRRTRADLFHSLHFVLPLTRVPSIVTIHDVIPQRFPYRNPVARLYYSVMLRRGVEKSVTVCTVSESAKADIISATRCPAGKIVVTPNGIDPVFFKPREFDQTHDRYFLYVGNDKPHKNVEALLSAFAVVRQRQPSVGLILAGAPFERFRDQPRVHLAGFVTTPHLAALYRGAIALVIPSLEEGFGLPAAEAMAAGTAVITSTAAALVELTADAALHADGSAAIAAAMLRVAGDESLRTRMIAAGAQRARLYTWQRCAAATREMYRSVLRNL
jgi:glycosyltransferase involved in cell wall biosynthesis